MQRSLVIGCLTGLCLSLAGAQSATAQGLRGRVDWMYLSRDNSASAQPFIVGPDTFGGSGGDFDFESGYRIMIGGGTPLFEVEAQFTQLDEWSKFTYKSLDQELVFDDNDTNPFIVGGTPGNVLTGTRAISIAAMDAITATMDDETLEGEFLIPGAVATYGYQSEYDDLEVNITTGRSRWFRFGLGYRHIDVSERSLFGVGGLFDALDADDGETVGGMNNDANDGLSDAALTEAGLTRIAGAGNGFDNLESAGGPDTLTLLFGATTSNRLNGIQGTFDGTIVDSQYFIVDVFGRLGVFHNDATAKFVETVSGSGNDNSVYSRTFQDSQNDLAFATGAGIRVALKLTDFLRLHTGYEFVYIDGLALAPDQMFRVGPEGIFTIDNNGDMVIHGGRAGIEVVW